MAAVELIMEDVEIKHRSGKPVADAGLRLNDLQRSARKLMRHESDWSLPYIVTAMATELNFLKSLSFPEYSDNVTDDDIEVRNSRYLDRLEKMLDVDRPGSLAQEYGILSQTLKSSYRKFFFAESMAKFYTEKYPFLEYLMYLSSSRHYDGFPKVALMTDIENAMSDYELESYDFYNRYDLNNLSSRAREWLAGRRAGDSWLTGSWPMRVPCLPYKYGMTTNFGMDCRNSRAPSIEASGVVLPNSNLWRTYSCGIKNLMKVTVMDARKNFGFVRTIRDRHLQNRPMDLDQMIGRRAERSVDSLDFNGWWWFGPPASEVRNQTRAGVRRDAAVVLRRERINEQCTICERVKSVLYSYLSDTFLSSQMTSKEDMKDYDPSEDSSLLREAEAWVSLSGDMFETIREVEKLVELGRPLPLPRRGDLHYSGGASCRMPGVKPAGSDCIRPGEILRELRSALKFAKYAILRLCAHPPAKG